MSHFETEQKVIRFLKQLLHNVKTVFEFSYNNTSKIEFSFSKTIG